jgi:hypothetical protein
MVESEASRVVSAHAGVVGDPRREGLASLCLSIANAVWIDRLNL